MRRKIALDLAVLVVVMLGTGAVVLTISSGSASEESPLTSVRATPTPVRTPEPTAVGPVAILVGAGDIAECDRHEDELTADVLERIPGTVFTLGDNAYPDGTSRDFEDCYGPTWGRPSIKERTRPAVGDNEYDTPGASGYFKYFGPAAGEAPSGYYGYDAGAWRVYVLNSECREAGGCEKGSPQEAWLLSDLEAEPRECVLAMWHEPLFSSSSGGGRSSMRNLWRVLQEAGAELVLSAHHHAYERFDPQTGGGIADPERGIVQIVAGTAGGDPEEFGSPSPNSVVRQSRVFGVLRLELAPGSYAFEFITVAGPEFSDQGSGMCH